MRGYLSLPAALVAVLTIASIPISSALAQDDRNYPEHPVTIIVPYPPGGSSDNTARPYAQHLSEHFGEEFVIENRGGAGGTIGAEVAARAKPDGYTLFLTPTAVLTIKPNVVENLAYTPLEDFEPISRVSESIGAIGVHPSVPADTVQELIALAKEKPGKLNFGSAGVGTITQMRGEIFKDVTGADIVHVPYRGSGPALNDLLAGHIDMMFDAVTLTQANSGNVKVLAVDSDERLPTFPDIPTVTEAGLPEYNAQSWFGLLAPAGTPQPIIDKLHAAVQKIAKKPELKKQLAGLGIVPVSDPSPKAFAEIIARDQAAYGEILDRLDQKAQ